MTIQVNHLSDNPSPEKGQPQPFCNLDYLHRMSGGDAGFVKEMIKIFLRQLPQEIEKIKITATTEDITTAKQIAHKLKSSASMVGAESMVSLLKEFEKSEVGGDIRQDIISFHFSLSELFIHIKAELEPLL